MSKEEKFQAWKEQAIKTQQMFYSIFGDRSWDVYQQSERHLLEKNIGYALYGPPETMPSKENGETGYSKKKLEQIRKLCELIVKWDEHDKISSETWVAILFVCLNENDECRPVPVFRVPELNLRGAKSIFIDYTGRIYKGWTKFLTENCLTECKYCYPKDGFYVGDENYNVQLEFGDTPACKTSKKVLDVLDKTNMGVAIGGTVIGLASLTALPIAAPIVAAGAISNIACFLYGTTRSVGTLIDKKNHGQSIGLSDGEARCCYLSMVGGVLGMASGVGSRLVARVAQNGELVSKTSRVLVTALNISSLATNGFGIVNNFFMLHEKYKSGELTCLDVFQFTSSVLFFTSAVVNVKTANMIIKETQESTMKNFEESLAFKKHRKLYRRMAKNTMADADDPIYGKAKVIKAMQHIDNPEEFFSNVNKVRRELHETKTDISFGETGTLTLNKEAQVDPSKFSTVGRTHRREFLAATKNLNEGTLSHAEFDKLLQQGNVSVESLQSSSSASTSTVTDKKHSLKLSEVTKAVDAHMNSLLKCAISLDVSDYQRLLCYAERLCREMGFHKTADVLDTLNFVIDFINSVANSMECQYQRDLQHAKEVHSERFNQHLFDEGYRLSGNRMKAFSVAIMSNMEKLYGLMRKVYRLFVSENVHDEHVFEECSNLVFDNMQVPNAMEIECSPPVQESQDVSSCRKFHTFSELDYPFFYERDFSSRGDLSDTELYEVAGFLVDVTVCEANSMLVREGSVSFVTANPTGLFATVMVVSHIEDHIVSAAIVS